MSTHYCIYRKGFVLRLLMLFFLMAGADFAANAQNSLRIDDLSALAGKEASIPIYLDNSQEVMGIQFDITLPYAKPINSDPVLDQNRSNGHTVSWLKINDTKYTVVVMSYGNKPLKGNSGLLLRIPSQVPSTAQIGDTKPVKLENIIISNATGHNIAEYATSEATFTVAYMDTPDLIITDLTINNSETTLVPGGKMQLNFNVKNQGTAQTGDGWTEKIYLEDETGTRSYVTQKSHEFTLDANDVRQRLYEVDIPKAMKIEGTVRAIVELVDLKNTGEQIVDQGNNNAVSSNTKTLEKRLFFSDTRILVGEGKSKTVTLTRSGNCTMEETFTLAEQNSHGLTMLSVPATVTIKAGQTAQTFKVKAIDDTEVNEQYRTGLAVNGDDYPEATMIVDVEDNDNYSLQLSLDKEEYTEDEEVAITVSIKEALADDLTVTITNTNAARFYPYVRSITIPAGQTSASATTRVVKDQYAEADKEVTFKASATGFDTPTVVVNIIDDDWPVLTMTLVPNVIAEDAGYAASTAVITREGDTSENLMLYMTSSNSEIFFESQKQIIPAGEKTISIPVSVKDNAMKDGERTHSIKATGMDAFTGKTTGSKASCSAQITIVDNDIESLLKLQSNKATLAEGGSQVTVTVSRNTTEGNLVVNLTSEDPQVVLPESVTIQNGKTSATFKVKATANTVDGDDHYANVKASATNYQSASFVFFVSDQSLPDAIPAAPVVTTSAPYYTSSDISGTIDITNQGLIPLPTGTVVDLYISTDRVITINRLYVSPMDKVGTVTTASDIESGETLTVPFSLTLPDNHVGVYYLFGWVNQEVAVQESNINNNWGKTFGMDIKAPFTVTSLTTDKPGYLPGETMTITGQMSNSVSGQPMDGKEIEIILIGDGNVLRERFVTTLDANGNFSTTLKIRDHYAGSYGVGARCKGITDIDTQYHISVTALKVEGNYTKLTLTEGVKTEGEVKVTNLSASEALTNISGAFADMPEEWVIEVGSLSQLGPQASGNLHYAITPTTPTNKKYYTRTQFNVTAKDASGNTAEAYKTFDYFANAASCKLVTSANGSIKTTLSKVSNRNWTLTVDNTGLIESGTITVECPADQPWLKATTHTLASIEPDGSSELTLNLTGDETMIVDGTYKSYVKLTPEHGKAIIVNVEATLVSTDIGTLKVDVVDAYTLADDHVDGPHVSGATVRLTNALTKEVVMTGETGADGLFTTDILKEGTYYVYVTAPNHYYSEKTVTVNAGVVNDVEIFLPYKAVKVTYTVEETTVVDEYRTLITLDVVPDVPQAVLVPTLPDWGCGLNTYSIRLTNKGRLTAYDPYLEFPNIEGYTFTVKSEYPHVVYPNESYDVTVEFNGQDTSPGSVIGAIVMHYGYKLRGEMYYGSDTYAAQVGCFGEPIVLPGGALGTGPQANHGGSIVKLPLVTSISDDDGLVALTEMPIISIHNPLVPTPPALALQFEQRFFLERQAFEGHLKVENLQMGAIEDVNVLPTVKRADDGTDATDLFAISYKGKGDWARGDWNLSPSATGEATVLYVPSKETAPTEKTDYLFGGKLTYRDVDTGQLITVDLTQTKLTVNPSPDLRLTYFIQRDFVSDDPRTEEVEPWEPAEFALLIQNKGAGDAINLEIVTGEPGAVSNLDGNPIKFTQLYTTVDGIEKNFNFNYINLGRIPAGQNVMARWWFYSDQSAHVTSYDVQMTKHSNYGVEFDLIKLEGVRELTRTVFGQLYRPTAQARANSQVPNTKANIYLLNLLPDEENLPDHVEDQNGELTDDLEIVSQNITAAEAGNNQYTLNVSASREGWVYGQIQDPTNHTMTLTRVVRNSDNADVTSNFWQTNRTITSDNSTLQANRLHMADNIGTTESYTLYFEPKPAEAPVVKSIVLSPNSPSAQKAVVTFKNAINASTFGPDDVVIMCGDKLYNATVTAVDDTKFIVDWSGNEVENGYTTLTVFTSGIANTEGTFGTSSKSKEWVADSSAIPGDVNGDGKVTITDVLMIIDKVHGHPSESFIEAVADLDGNGSVTMADAIAVMNSILSTQ